MKTKGKVLSVLLVGCLLTLAAWLAEAPAPAQLGVGEKVPEKYSETVRKGLEYLVKNQCKDGHWEGDDGKHPVAMTGLAGMALLMEGSNVENGKYSAAIRKAFDWLIEKSQAEREGLIFSDHPSERDRYMYGHGLATQFLAWAYRNGVDKACQEKLRSILTRAVKYIVKAQSSQGGWYRTSKVEGHDLDEIAATAIQIQALCMDGHLSIPVRNETITGAQEYLKLALEKYEKDDKRGQKRNRPAETAAALACQSTPLAYVGNELCKKWFKYCEAEIRVGRAIQVGRDELTHYFYSQAVLNDSIGKRVDDATDWSGTSAWAIYRTAMFDLLQSSQNKDGSWPAGDGISVGQVYSTAVWCTILQLDTRHHPLTRQRLRVQF